MAPSKEIVPAGSKEIVAIDPDQTLKASKALLSHIKKAAQEKAQDPAAKRNLLSAADDLDDVEQPIWLTLTTKRHIADKARLQPGKIPLPHPINTDESSTICLITADPQRAYKDVVASEGFPEELRKRVTRVIGFSKIKAKFSQYEAQRKLFSEHDFFLADDRIINRLPGTLGKTFYKTTAKRPIPVVISGQNKKKSGEAKGKGKKADKDATPNIASAAQIAREIEKALSSALVNLSPTTNTAVRVGLSTFTSEQIADNVSAVTAALVEKYVPQKWRNVRSLYIKGPETAALPIWQTDELWVDGTNVISDEAAAKLLEDAKEKEREKANIGKKRKNVEEDAAQDKKDAKKAKKGKKEELPGSDDKVLDKQISERKKTLRKQKAAAAKAMD